MDLLIALVVVLALILGGLVIWMGLPKGPRLRDVEHMRVPHITEMGPQKVLEVEAKGDPSVVAKDAFGLVMKAYFKLKGVPKGGPEFKAPRGRWEVDPGRPQEEWLGYYAMPVPSTVEEVPEVKNEKGFPLRLRNWDYGPVAQILHVGPYDQEMENIQKLHGFIRSQSYEIAGLHEEEYLRGPGLLFRGDPNSYLTVIRYPVRKVGGGED